MRSFPLTGGTPKYHLRPPTKTTLNSVVCLTAGRHDLVFEVAFGSDDAAATRSECDGAPHSPCGCRISCAISVGPLNPGSYRDRVHGYAGEGHPATVRSPNIYSSRIDHCLRHWQNLQVPRDRVIAHVAHAAVLHRDQHFIGFGVGGCIVRLPRVDEQ